MIQLETIKTTFIRLVALTLLTLGAAFTFPEAHYSVEKTFEKSPTPQAAVYSVLADDMEDSDEFSSDTQFFQDFSVLLFAFPAVDIVSAKTLHVIEIHGCSEIYLHVRQLLI